MARAWPQRLPALCSGLSCGWLLPLPAIFSQSGVALVAFFYVLYGWILLAVGFAAVLIFSAQARSAPLRHRLITPAVLIIAAAMFASYAWAGAASHPFFGLRFRLSQSALTEMADRKRAMPWTDVPARVGLFPVLSAEVHEGTVRFITTDCGVVDRCGLAYSPHRAPSRLFEDRFTALGGGWYHLFQGF